MSGILNLVEQSENVLVLGVESESAGSEEDFAGIGTALPGIGIEGEEGMEFSDAL